MISRVRIDIDIQSSYGPRYRSWQNEFYDQPFLCLTLPLFYYVVQTNFQAQLTSFSLKINYKTNFFLIIYIISLHICYGCIENIFTCTVILYILEAKQYTLNNWEMRKNMFIFISVLTISTNRLIKVNPLPLGSNNQWMHKMLLISAFENKIRRTVTKFTIPAAKSFC